MGNEYGQSAMMLCSWRVKAGWLIPFVNKRVGDGQVKLCDPSLTRANPELIRDEYCTDSLEGAIQI